MTIPVVIQGTVEVEGKVFELDSSKGSTWLESIGSFRFEPSNDGKPCTVRREPSGYWYGCRKVAGKVRKKYIGKSSEVNTAKLEEIAESLEVPPVPRVNKVAEVAQEVTQDTQVAEKVVEVAESRLTALELEVANLRKALEALQEALPGKLESGDSVELPKVDNAVAEELQNELSNLKAENEHLRQKLAESRDTIETLNWGTEALNEQLKAVRAENQRLQNDLGNSQAEVIELRSQLEAEKKTGEEREEEFWGLHEQWDSSKKEIQQLEAELADLKQKSAAASKDLPEAADLLNQLKAHRKKSSATLADVEKILEILEGT
jgi:chromosome segregation ATPase